MANRLMHLRPRCIIRCVLYSTGICDNFEGESEKDVCMQC